MKISISNLAWGNTPLNEVIPKLAAAGVQGIEVAPTAIWPNLSKVRDKDLLEFKRYLEDHNLSVSGIQSLLYGHPELKLFDQNCWNDLRKHLEKVIRFGGLLSANVAVFGSPKNRVRGDLEINEANELATSFFKQIEPCLMENNVVLTLEPNAPQYGADYLVSYEDVILLSHQIDSPSIRPQIDTGCLWMIGESPIEAYELFAPHHIHLSTPNLGSVPGFFDFDPIFKFLAKSRYSGWAVIEMLQSKPGDLEELQKTLDWLKADNGMKESWG